MLNLFLALLLSSFGAESLKHSEEEEGPNKLQEAVDRINRFSVYVRSHAGYVVNVYVRRRGGALHDADDPDTAYGYLAGPDKPHSIAAAAAMTTGCGGHVHKVETSPDGVDGAVSAISPQHHQANGETAGRKCFARPSHAPKRRYWVSERLAFNVPVNRLRIISKSSLPSQSLALVLTT